MTKTPEDSPKITGEGNLASAAARRRLGFLLMMLCAACVLIFTLWSTHLPLPAQNWIGANLDKIRHEKTGDISFAVFGDCRDDFSCLGAILRHISTTPNLDFAICIGDLVDQGDREDFYFFLEEVKRNLKIPFLTALGNHDTEPNGPGAYGRIFGPLYYSFEIGKNHFTVMNGASTKMLDPEQRIWLEKDLAAARGCATRLVFTHIPLYDPRGGSLAHCMQPAAAKDLVDLFTEYRVTHVFSSHIHGYFTGAWEGIPYTITGGGGAPLQGNTPDHFFFHYLLVDIKGGAVGIEMRKIPSQDIGWLESFRVKTPLVLSHLARIAGIPFALLLALAGIGWVLFAPGRTIGRGALRR